MTLGEMLERSAERFPEKTAIVYKEQEVSYQELNARVNKLGRALNALGVGKNDKVGIIMPNCPEFIIAVFAALKAGGVFVGLNALLSGRELTYVIDHSDAKVIIAAPPYDELLVMLKPQLPSVQHILTLDEDPDEESLISIPALVESYDDSNLKPSVTLDDIAALYYTSGTTGLPKGAMLTHVNILSSTVAIGKVVRVSRNDVPLNCLPLFHTLAMTACIMVPIFGGMTNVLLDNFLPHPVLQGFNDWKVTIFVAVPTMFAVLANMPNLAKYDVSNLRLGYCGGAPLTDAVAENFESKFPATIHEGYGLSECAPLVTANPVGKRKIGSIGTPVDRVSVKIVDPNRTELPRNTVGEICVSGPNVMKGYYKDDEATSAVIFGKEGCVVTAEALDKLKRDGIPDTILAALTRVKDREFNLELEFLAILNKLLGKEDASKYRDPILHHTRRRWFLTGDMAYMDDDGYVYIADRKKDMIIVGGENVYPKEVENVLTQHPTVKDAGVVGIEDPIRGEVPKAYIAVKLGASIDEKDILAYCRKHLAPYKIPREIEVIDEIPKNITGKILKKTLRRMAAGLPPEEDDDDDDFDDDDFDDDDDDIEDINDAVAVDDVEVDDVEEIEEPVMEEPPMPAGGVSLEEQMRQMEGGGTPPAGGLNLEEQMRQMEGGGGSGPSLEAQMRQMEGGGTSAPAPQAPPSGGAEGGFEDHLRNLVMEVPGGIAGSIADIDGIGIAAFSTDPDFQTQIADAEIASILNAFKKASKSLDAGSPQEAFIVTDRFGIALRSVRNQYVISVVVEANELNWGLTRVQINKIVPLIEQELF